VRQKFHDWLFERAEEEDEASDVWGHVRCKQKKRLSDSIYKLGWKLIWLALKIHR
jgi:hypothetical protein